MKKVVISGYLLFLGSIPATAFAMHIAEGFLPQQYCYIWFAAAAPFILIGLNKINKITKQHSSLSKSCYWDWRLHLSLYYQH